MGPTPTCSTIPHAKIPQLAYLSTALAHLKADEYAHMRHMSIKLPKLDFTQNLAEATDAITLGCRHSWLESEGFSLSAANADVQELPATLYVTVQI